MNRMGGLLMLKLRYLAAAVLDSRRGAIVRTISTSVFLLSLIYGAYVFFYGFIFKYIALLEEIGYLLIERLVSVGFLAFFFMLVISSFAVALATLFRSAETEYLFSTPVGPLVVFTGKLVDIVVYSAWAMLVMGLPILYAYARIMHFGIVQYMLGVLLVLVPFILSATSIGALLALVAVYASKRYALRRLILGGLGVFVLFAYLAVTFAQPNQLVIPFSEDFRSLNLFINNFRLNSHPYAPNFWFIQSLRALSQHEYRPFFLYVSALASTAFFFMTLLYVAAERMFFPTWLISSEQMRLRAGSPELPSAWGGLVRIRPGAGQAMTLMQKDAVLFLREPGQWAPLLLVFSLLVIYFFNLRLIPRDIEIEQWRTIIAVMNFAFTGFILATLAVRFVYPSISLEGPSFWVVGSAPLPVSVVFREKLWVAFGMFVVVAEIIAAISGSILDLEPLYRYLTVAGIFLMSLSLACLSVGFGAAFPDFTERNPSKISSSPGGVLTVLVSLFYIAVMTALVGWPSYHYTRYLVIGTQFPSLQIAVAAVAAIIVNAAVSVTPLMLGARALRTREF